MSGGRRAGMGTPYQQHAGPPQAQAAHPYMGHMGPGQQPQQQQQQQRFMMGPGQMSGQMYGPGPTPPPSGAPQMYGPGPGPQSGAAPQMYGMPSSSSQQGGAMGGAMPGHPGSHPGPPVSPAARPPTPQHLQQQHLQHQQHPMQMMMQNSPKQPSPAPSASSEHGSTHSNKPGEDGPDIKAEPTSGEEAAGDASRGNTNNSSNTSRPVPSPAGSTGSRSNTPASITGGPVGSPMPVRPNSGQLDGQNRMTQSPMATQGYNQQMMPPPNSMGYMPTSSGKIGAPPMPGHYPQYNSQYPQGNYGRQQPGMPGMGGPPMSGPMQSYPSSQPSMYPSGPAQMSGQMSGPMQSQMGGPPMYGMNRSGQGGYYPPQPGMMGGGGQYPPYSSPHMGPMHSMPQQQQGAPQGMLPQQMGGVGPPTSAPGPTNKASMMAASNNLGPRSMASSRGAVSPSRGMFSQSGAAGGPLAQMNNMTNSPNLGSPSLNSMSNAVEQLTRGMPPHSSSSPSPVPKSAANTGPSTDPHSNHMSSPSAADFHENSTSNAGAPPDLPTNESTTGSDSSGGVPSDSTSVDSGFHSSDQGDKTSDSVNSSSQPGLSPPPPQQPNGDHHHHHQHHHHHHQQQQQQHPHVHPHHSQYQQQAGYPPRTSDSSQQYMSPQHPPGVPLPPSSLSSAMASLPSSTGVVTTTSPGAMSTSVTQSIAAPVTSTSTLAPPHPSHPQSHHMGGQAPPHSMMGSHHGMGPPPHGMMPNGGMPPNSMMPPGGHMGHGGPPGHMGSHMGHSGMMPPHSMNGPMMGSGGQMMGHNGPMVPGGHSGNMPPMGQMSMQQQPTPPLQANCMPPTSNSNNIGSNITPSEDPPEKKKKNKKSSDLSKLFEMGTEPDRRPFIERVLSFLEESGQPVTAMPVISKTPIDLYKLYFCVREKGGFEEVTRNKKWRDVCQVVNIGTSASAAFTLKKNYIRYLFNYECKFDRGGINPAPILAQMEAQLAHKREQKSKRAPSPAGSTNSNDAFRPPSVPNNQGEPGYPQNMPPPYMQPGPDGSMPPNPHMSGGTMMMGPGGPPPPPSMGGMMGGPPNMMPGVMGGPPGPPPQSMMGQGYSAAGGPPPMMPGQQGPITSNSVSVQDPFSDESSYHSRGPPSSSSGQPTPPPPSQSSGPPVPSSLPSSYPMSSSGMSGTNTMTSASNMGGRVGEHPPHPQQMGFQATNCVGPPPGTDTPASEAQFPFGQQFDRPDRYSQSSPSLGGPRPPAPLPDSSGAPPGTPMYSSGGGPPRFSSPQYPAGGAPPYQGPAYSGYPPPPGAQQGGHYSAGPRPPYGTPSKRFPEDHAERGQWSPMQRSRQLPPVSPSTPPMGPYSRQLTAPRTSPHSRDRYAAHKVPPAYGGPLAASLGKKDLSFPPDCVESVGIASVKRKRLTHKDLAPFEAWRLMLSLKSGLLAESTWALDTMSVLLRDDATYGYFSLNTLPGLLEVLTEHFRHCLLSMFDGFDDLEAGQTTRRPRKARTLQTRGEDDEQGKQVEDQSPRPEDELSVKLLSGSNYTLVSRKGLPVKLDHNPVDSTVLESKAWDVYSGFHTSSDHWSQGCGDITDHILTHLESSDTNSFLAAKFKRKRSGCEGLQPVDTCSEHKRSRSEWKHIPAPPSAEAAAAGKSFSNADKTIVAASDSHSDTSGVATVAASDSHGDTSSVKQELSGCNHEADNSSSSTVVNSTSLHKSLDCSVDSKVQLPNPMCNGDDGVEKKEGNGSDSKEKVLDLVDVVQVKLEPEDNGFPTEQGTPLQDNGHPEKQSVPPLQACNGKENGKVSHNNSGKREKQEKVSVKPVENGDIEKPTLSPMVNHLDKACSSPQSTLVAGKDSDDGGDISPPVLKAEVLVEEEEEEMEAEEAEGSILNSTMKADSTGVSMEVDASIVAGDIKEEEDKKNGEGDGGQARDDQHNSLASLLSDSCPPSGNQTEELSASFVSEIQREQEAVEEEAFQRDDPPLCVTPESRDELGRRCVCISNIFRSLSCVPGNEAVITKHAGIMRILGKLLLLQHSHPAKPAPRRLPHAEEDEDDEEKEEESPPRVYDDAHWWWDYLDQLRENTLVILANVCGHLQLASFSEAVCFPLLEGLLHWITCPASVARDPLPTLGGSSPLSPERLVLEALCKLCIHETNVDLLLATAHIKRLLALYSVLVRLLADRQHQIPREFSIVLLSLLVPADGSVARAVALQPPSVTLLVDFLETAEQAALTIASQQGLDVLQANPEVMGTSLDMLRRAASILLSMARVPDNRKLFMPQQSRLLNLVMSQILDQSVSNTLAEVLFECSHYS